MKASFLAVAILATIAIRVSSAVDGECLQRKLLGLPLHWPNPANCSSFYRCTNKNLKRHILCPANKEYNTKSGRCGPMGRNLCKLSLKLAVDESSNPCQNVLSGTYLADAKNCRNFYICNNDLAYPQSCDVGSCFDTAQAVCVPDATLQCWENFCLDKANGVYMPNTNDCYSFYICSNKLTVPQECPIGSYFDKDALNCHPGICPTDVTTSTTQTSSVPTEPSSTSTTTTSISTTKWPTTTCETTTCETTTCESTTMSTTTCETTTCESTTKSTTTPYDDSTTSSTTCTTPYDGETTTAKDIEEECAQWNCDQQKCIQVNDFTLFPAKDDNKLYCMCLNHEALCRECPQGHEFIPSQGGCAHNDASTTSPAPETSTTTPCDEVPTTTCFDDDTTTATTTDKECAQSHCEHANCVNAPDLTILPSSSGDNKFFCLCVNKIALCRQCPDGSEFLPAIGACFPTKPTTPIATETTTCVTPSDLRCDGMDLCRKADDDYRLFPCPGSDAAYCVCIDEEAIYRECDNGNIYNDTVGRCVPESSTAHKCKGNVEEGERVPNPNDCMLFFICSDGELIESSCGVGNYFNKATENCKPDTDGICQDSSTKNSRNKRSIPELPSDMEANCCPDGLDNGDVIPHPTDCDKKLVCCDGDLKEESCDQGFYFNAALKECVKDVNNACWPRPECVDGQVEQHPTECSMYLACCHGLLKEKTCEQGYYFNPSVKKCIKDVNHFCKPVACTCDGGVEEGENIPNPKNCSSYFQCCNGDLIEEFCGIGMLFDKKSGRCVADVNNFCWPKEPECDGGVGEGENVPNPKNCSSYLKCCNGDLIEEFCGIGMLFDKKSAQCVADVNNVCWPKEPECDGGVGEGENVPNPKNCSSYLKCCNGDLIEEFCGIGMLFDKKSAQCVADVNNVCWPKEPECDGGVGEGENVPNPKNCSSYLKCCNGDLIEEFCGIGMLFDKKSAQCVADVNNVCWPKEPECDGGVGEGENVPNPKNCSSYLKCCNGDLIEEFCGIGMLFDKKSAQCVADVNNVCWPKEPECDGGVGEGENVPNPKNCSSYLKCCNGDLIEEFCGIGMLFDKKSGQCVADVNNVCWPKEPECDGGVGEGENVPNPKNCSSYLKCCNGDLIEEFCGIGMLFDKKSGQCVADVNNVCWPKEPECDGGVGEGENVPNPKNCSSYLKCCNGDLIEEFCGIGMLFDKKSAQCVADVNNVCWPKEPECDGGVGEGENVPNPKNCSSYLKCCNGDLIEEFCGIGMLFDKKSAQCVADVNNVCWPKEPCTCSGGYQEGEKSPAKDCDKYYTCIGGIQVLGECGENMYYNSSSETCLPDTEDKCWTNGCAGKPNGTMVVNPNQCNGFYICENGKQSGEGLCETGEWFDPKQSSCQLDMDAVCYNPCAGQDQIKMLPHPDCRKFYFCNANQTIVETCPVGGFDANIGDCNPDKKCSENDCEDKPDYYTYAYDKDKTKFYICLKGVPVLKSCLPNTEYNGQVCAHVSSPDCDQTPCATLDYLIAYPTLNETEDNAFCVCRKGYATKQYCAADYVFNASMAACYSDAPCDPLMCTLTPDYTVFVNHKDNQSFCLCSDKKAVIVACPNNGTFNSALLSCTNNEISIRCDQRECIVRDDYFTYPDNTQSSEGFCICKGHTGAFQKCPKNSSFDVTMGVCRINNIQCDVSKCIGLPDHTNIAALISSQGYCECVNGNATYYNCKNNGEFDAVSQKCMEPLCNPETCLKADDYTRFAAVGSTHGFCMCLNQEVVYKSCEEGGVFNTAMLVCQMPLINCPDSLCTGVADKTKLPADYSIYGYCMCSGGKATYQECPTGQIYEAAKQTCEKENVPVEDVCDITYCDDLAHADHKYPSVKNIYGYCECSAAGPTFQHCPTGEIFDISLLACRATVSSQCDLAFCADATPTHGYPIPTKTGNTSTFCYCTGPGSAMLINCPTDLFYNDKQKKCVTTIQEGCSCPGGLHNGDVAQDVNNCTKYFLCNSGSMHQQTCPSGQYFNAKCKKCEDDTTGLCVKKEACTCLGTYREGERLEHSDNEQMYYICENQILHERDCGTGHIFNKAIQQCMEAPHLSSRHYPQKRSVDFDEFHCLEDDKRSLPSNCSEYELCRNHTWYLHSCQPFNYYNPEKKQCLEPRDDTVCAYAKVANISMCNADSEGQLKKGRTCQNFFFCHELKWHLISCGREEYFDNRIKSCLAHHGGDKFECSSIENGTEHEQHSHHTESCQDLSMLPYSVNCAMYLICLGNQWWYNYCPSGMYFNRTLNYCLPDEKIVCPYSIKSMNQQDMNATHGEIPEESCPQEGLLRPSNWACSRYYICIAGLWKEQNCAPLDYFDATKSQCSPDPKGVCPKSQLNCMPQEKRIVAANCSAYDECTLGGQWIRLKCPKGQMYDETLKECIENDDGTCSSEGLRKVCYPQQYHKVSTNCTQFFYCLENQWALGSCRKGNMYSSKKQMCVPHSPANICKPLNGNQLEAELIDMNLCSKQLDGTFIPHDTDCLRYYVCVNKTASHEMQCPNGSFFDNNLGYCRPNDGSCRVHLSGECENLPENSRLPHPTDCQAYYICSSVRGQQLLHCPAGEYFHNQTHQCHPDKGECKGQAYLNRKCLNQTHGMRLPHDIYCNIYYICVKDMAMAMECPENYEFNAVLHQCTYAQNHTSTCQHIKLKDANQNPNCGNFSDSFYIADSRNCTHYYICSEGQAHVRKCPLTTYFNAKQLLCIPDDGHCAVVHAEEANHNLSPSDPNVCKDQHGKLMPDSVNCNNFYVCINGKLRHERCYPQFFFNVTLNQCQQTAMNEETLMAKAMQVLQHTAECKLNATSTQSMCSEYGVGASLAEPGDCRFYIACEEKGIASSQRCRNGESYDNLLGICRQNDGTCQMDSGQRAGKCNQRHGQLTKDNNNCRKYFACLNGQKIVQFCKTDEYFSPTENMCLSDISNTCPEESLSQDLSVQPKSCKGLTEAVFYPNIPDNCRSYFQCVQGVVKIQKCNDNLYFDPITTQCIKNSTVCRMPTQTEQRSPILGNHTYKKLCLKQDLEQPFANFANKCRSFYTCHDNDEVSHELCPLGMAFDPRLSRCLPEENVICDKVL